MPSSTSWRQKISALRIDSVSRQLSEDGERSHSSGLLGRLQTGIGAEHPDNRDPSGFESAGLAGSDLAALLSRAARKQLPLLRSAANLRAVSAHVHTCVHTRRWN